jgi:methionyl-tRNA formyltransferase
VWDSDVLAFCAREGIPVVEVASLSSPDGVSALRALHPDVCIHAGAGILRAETLEVPRLGTLNAHMGRLPAYRGMNVVEWAVFNRDDTGCSVHLVNRGIDLGDILCTERVDRGGRRSLAEVRRAVDDAQIALLGRTIEYVLATGELPPRFAQADLPGRQYFRLHPRLRAVLDAELASA